MVSDAGAWGGPQEHLSYRLHGASRTRPDGSSPTRLYHYTSPAGLLDMLSSSNQVMWATDARFLNDASELSIGWRLARQRAGSIVRATEGKPAEHRIADAFFEGMFEEGHSLAGRVFVASFSEEDDLLSQWRAYCPPSGGYALGISRAQLMLMAEEQGFILVKCLYHSEEHLQFVNTQIDELWLRWRDRWPEKDQPTPADAFGAGKSAAREIAQAAAILKDWSFREEKEWRLISDPNANVEQRVLFRSGRRSVVPYTEFLLHIDGLSESDLIRCHDDDELRIVVGPTRDRPGAYSAVADMLARTFCGGVCDSSSTPFREP